MKILITGSAGFIGFHLSKSMLEDGFEILGIDDLNSYYNPKLKKDRLSILKKYSNFKFAKIDIANLKELKNHFIKFSPHKVVNLAAQPGVRYSLKNPNSYLNSNIKGFLNIIELCRKSDVMGLIYASSSSVYGKNNTIPFEISQTTDTPISLYGASKKTNELIAHSYSHLYGLKTTGLRFFTVYGPWYRPDMGMYIFIKNILENKPINVFNNGKMKRDFTYIDDIIEGTKAAIEKNYQYEIFNLGNSKSEDLKEMISIIEHELDKKALIKYKPLQPGDNIETFADISLSTKKLGFKPKTNLKTGLPSLINWYKEYHKIK